MHRARFLFILVAVLGISAAASVHPSAQPPAATQDSLFHELQWRMIGPFRGGRTKSATGVPGQPGVFYMGPVNSGVWKSTDYGNTWKPIFDDQPTGSIGAIAVAPSNPDVLYVGSGEGMQRPDLSVGDGMYKSTDAGKTWTHLGLRDGQQIPQIVVDPHNPDRLFVAVLGHPYGPNEERGIFRSTDGGRSFQKVLYKDENTGAADVALDPSNANHVYAVLWEARQGPWENGVFTGPNSGLFESTDGGDTWKPMMNGLPTFEQGLGRIGIGVAPSNPKRLFATVQARQGEGLYRSDDAGQSWYKVTENTTIVTRGDDFAEVKVDPKNADIVYTASIVAWKSVDGGKTFHPLRGAPGGDDYQRIWISPDDSRVIILGVDQGATVTVNGGETWSTWYNQPTAQFYHVSTDNAFPYRVCGGQQDSGSACVQSRSDDGRITFRDWHPVGAEEYAYVAPDPLDPDIVYGGRVSRYNRKTGEVLDVAPRPLQGGQSGDYRTVRTQPLVFSTVDPHILYSASNTLWKTTTGGMQGWTQISPDLTRKTWTVPANVGIFKDTPAAQPSQKGVIYTIAPGHLDVNRIWVGTDDGLIHTTADGGKTWTNVTPPDLGPWAKVSMMDASHTDALGAYAAINTLRLDELHPRIYRTHDGGKTWTAIVSGIPDGDVVNTVKEDPKQKGLLFAGTETQVYASLDDGDHWQSLRLNMPATSIRDLTIKDDDLVVGTHGRGFWILDDITPLRQVAASFDKATDRLFKPASTIRFDWSKYTDTPLPPDEPAGQNPPDGAIIDYYLAQPAQGVVTLEILDASGGVVRRYASDEKVPPVADTPNVPAYWIRRPQVLSADAGLHRFVWDLHYPMLAGAEPQYPISATPHNTAPEPKGPWVVPGTYTVRLTANGRSLTQPLTIKMDPRVKTGLLAARQQFALAKRVYDAVADVHATMAKATDAQQQAQSSGNAERAQQLGAVLGAGGGRGRGRGRGSSAGTQATLASVAARLSGVYGLTQQGNGPIPPQAVKVVNEALTEYGALMTRVRALLR